MGLGEAHALKLLQLCNLIEYTYHAREVFLGWFKTTITLVQLSKTQLRWF